MIIVELKSGVTDHAACQGIIFRVRWLDKVQVEYRNKSYGKQLTVNEWIYMRALRIQSMNFQFMFGVALSCFDHTRCILQPGLCVMNINAALYTKNVDSSVHKKSSLKTHFYIFIAGY